MFENIEQVLACVACRLVIPFRAVEHQARDGRIP
jgi:hypothetical protein